MKILIAFLLAVLCLFPLAAKAQEVSTKEAGAYERKSVTYINALWLMDESARRLSTDQVALILEKTKKAVSMARFDYNPVPESFLADFVTQANEVKYPYVNEDVNTAGGTDPMIDSIAAILDRTVVPKVLAIVDLAKEMRAQNLTSEQQRNSFITDKAKMLGITMDDVQKVMNSAFMYIPLARGYTSSLKDSTYTTGFAAGIIWFRISTTGEKASAVPVVKKFTYSSGFSIKDRHYATDAGMVGYQEFAFRSAVKNAVRNLTVATQEIPEFKMSAQVIDKGFMSVGINIGKNEGLTVDDKYQIVESFEEADGKTTTKKAGWVLVTSVADSNSKQGYKSKAQVISGNPYTGEVVSEFPRLPLDIQIGGRMFPYKAAPDTVGSLMDSSFTLNNSYGADIDIFYNIGRMMGLNQFFVGLSGGVGFGMVSGFKNTTGTGSESHGRAKMTGLLSWCAELSLVKKFYIGRVALVLQPGVGYHSLILTSDSWRNGTTGTDEYYSLTNAAIGFSGNAGLELAVSPEVNFGAGVGYQYFTASSSWDYSYKKGVDGKFEKIATINNTNAVDRTGLSARVYLVWSPPSLQFDPVDMVQGLAGGVK
jgi:hypothetical protein